MLRQFQERLAFEESESLSHLFNDLERIDAKERHQYKRTLPKHFTIRQAAFFLDVPESALRKKIETREVKSIRSTVRDITLIPREEAVRILKNTDLLTQLHHS